MPKMGGLSICSAAFLSIALAGCGASVKQTALAVESAEGPRQKLAFDALNRLREAFNKGACQPIFDDANAAFRLLQARQEWIGNCEQSRESLGFWQSFRGQAKRNITGPAEVSVEGQALFTGGDYHLRTIWRLNGSRAELVSLSLKRGGEQIVWPPPPFHLPDRLLDPPPKRLRTSDRSG